MEPATQRMIDGHLSGQEAAKPEYEQVNAVHPANTVGQHEPITFIHYRKLKRDGLFEGLFIKDPDVIKAIEDTMLEKGFDHAHPIVVWKEKGVVVDGYTRLQAITNLYDTSRVQGEGLALVPVLQRSFSDAEEAVNYAIYSQTARRNLTDGEYLRLVKQIDKLSENWGGTRTKGSSFADAKLDSRERTASIIGISKDKVSKCRYVLEHCDDQTIEAIYKGKRTLYAVYWQSRESGGRERHKYFQQEQRRAIAHQLDSEAFESGHNRGNRGAVLREHLDNLCLDLMPELSKKEALIQKIRKELEFVKDSGEIEALLKLKPMQEFLQSPLMDDMISVFEYLGFPVTRPPGYRPAIRPEKQKKSRARFDIGTVNRMGFKKKR